MACVRERCNPKGEKTRLRREALVPVTGARSLLYSLLSVTVSWSLPFFLLTASSLCASLVQPAAAVRLPQIPGQAASIPGQVASKPSSLQMPFHPRDLLPLLPHAVSYNIMQNLRSPVDIFPAYVGSLVPGEVLNWTGTCFRENLGFVNLTEGGKGAGDQGGLVVNVVTRASSSWTCMDLYAFATPWRLTGDYFYFSRHHSFHLDWLHPGERAYVLNKGLALFLMPAGFLGTVRALADVVPLFSGSSLGEAAQLEFLRRKMGATFVQREQPFAANVTPAMAAHFQSGDFIVTSKVRGFWGGFETLQKWVTGSWSGHTAMFMRDANGTLWVAESGHLTEQMEPIIQTQTFEAWWAHQLADPDEPSIAVLPLHPRLRKIFNETAAWEFVTGMEGQPFGFHNIIFSWIDTPKDNYPPPINSQLAAAVMSMWVRVMPEYASKLWNEALNMRLGTSGLDVAQVLAECAARRIPFGELLAVPERDSWQYSDGKSTSCVAYVMTAWKDGGLFGANASDIQVTEFTIKDAYQLNFFDDDAARIGAWCPQSASSPKEYCQILGKWRLDLPGFNTLEPYPRMNEACPSMAPDYYRPSNC